VQELADWIIGICKNDARIDPVDPSTLIFD